MGVKNRFRGSAKRLLDKYGNSGTLHIPNGPAVYNETTGDSIAPEDTYPVRYTVTPQKTQLGIDYGLATFQDGIVTFYVDVIDVVVNETCYITDLNGVKWGINTLNTLRVDDLVIAYEATMKAHV